MNNANITLSCYDLFLVEMALDETMWKLDPHNPTYKKFEDISKRISSARKLAEGSDEPVEINPVYDTLIEDLDFSIRTYNGLKRNSINTVGDLVKCTDNQLLNMKGLGKHSLCEIDNALATNFNLKRKSSV